MNLIEIPAAAEDASLLGRRVQEAPGLREVRPGTTITQGGKPIIVYDRLPGDWAELRSILRHIKYSKNRRMTQMNGQNEVQHTIDTTFGFKPSNPVFGTPAGACRFTTEFPGWYERIVALGEQLMGYYEAANPTKYAAHKQWIEANINPRWRVGNTIYTQGVINDANALGYHYDRDNYEGGWSCMVYFSHKVRGGNLIIPSLGLKFICEDSTYMLFDGQGVMHGVTPIVKLTPHSYRYSIVYYTRASMVGLGTYEEELTRIKQIEMNKHLKRMRGHSETN